jgi:hypothetical protein
MIEGIEKFHESFTSSRSANLTTSSTQIFDNMISDSTDRRAIIQTCDDSAILPLVSSTDDSNKRKRAKVGGARQV